MPRSLSPLLLLALLAPLSNGQNPEADERRAALQRLVNQGNESFRAGQYASAEASYAQALADRNPGLPGEQIPIVHLNLAHTRYRMEAWTTAIESYASSGAPDADEWIAQCHLQLGHQELALESLRAARRNAPGKLELLEQIARLEASLLQPEAAARSYTALLAERPLDATLHRALGVQLLSLGRSVEALDRFELAWRLGLREADLARLIGDLYLQEDMRLEAAAFYTKFLGLTESPGAEDHFRIGYTYLQGGEDHSARSFFERAIELDPSYAEAHLYLGQTDLADGNPDGALADFQRALEADDTLAAAHEAIGGIELRRGNYDAAVESFTQAMKLGEVDFSTHYNLVQSLLRAERRDQAVAALKRALRQHPGRRELLELLKVVSRPSR